MATRPDAPWAALAGLAVQGYEIHHGQTQAQAGRADQAVHPALPQGLGWQNAQGNVLGVYLHGLFEDAAVLERLFGVTAGQRVRTLDVVFDGLADFAQTHFAPGVLDGLLHPRDWSLDRAAS